MQGEGDFPILFVLVNCAEELAVEGDLDGRSFALRRGNREMRVAECAAEIGLYSGNVCRRHAVPSRAAAWAKAEDPLFFVSGAGPTPDWDRCARALRAVSAISAAARF